MNRKSIVASIAFAFLLGTSVASWAQDKPAVVGFSIAKKDAASEYDQSYVPGTQAGVQIYLRISLPKNTILKVDGENTSLKVTDSASKELAGNENSDVSFFASIADDKHSAIVPVQCTDLPSAGATSLTVSGTAALSCGADPKSETVAIAIKEGGELKLGPVTASITGIEDGFEPETKRINLEGKTSFDTFESIVFLDKKGNEVETSSAGGGSFGFGGDMTYSKSYQIKGDTADIASAKISYFQKIDSVKVPIDVKFGLDLGK